MSVEINCPQTVIEITGVLLLPLSAVAYSSAPTRCDVIIARDKLVYYFNTTSHIWSSIILSLLVHFTVILPSTD